MHSRKQFEPERSFETFNQLAHTIEACLGIVLIVQISLSILYSAGNQLKLLLRCITAIMIAEDKVTFNFCQDMPQIISIWSVVVFDVYSN
jgi:hypothetical protein